MTNRSPKGKRITKIVNQEVVERKISVLPWDALPTYQDPEYTIYEQKYTSPYIIAYDGGSLKFVDRNLTVTDDNKAVAEFMMGNSRESITFTKTFSSKVIAGKTVLSCAVVLHAACERDDKIIFLTQQ